MKRKFRRENAIFEGLQLHGYAVRDLVPAFPGSSEDEIRQRLLDNALRYRRTVERFGYLGTRECESRYFNVSSERYRRSPSAPSVDAASDVLTHCYGGSTTAGHNVGDDETWPHYLEQLLRRDNPAERVLNYGAGNHTSIHSALHLLDHCLSGRAPSRAIFFNGFNDCFYATGNPDGALMFLDAALELSQHTPGVEVPIGQIADMVPRLSDRRNIGEIALREDSSGPDQLAIVQSRYRVAAKIHEICEELWGVRVLRFWEPSPFVFCRPDQDLVPRLRLGSPTLQQTASLLKQVAAKGARRAMGVRDVVDLSAIGQEQIPDPLFLDEAHATPALNRLIAARIESHCDRTQRAIRRRVGRRSSTGIRYSSRPDPESDLYPMW